MRLLPSVHFPSLFSFSQTMGNGAALVASDNASAGANGTITGTLSGTYQASSGGSCNAANHQLEMVKLCEQKFDRASGTAPMCRALGCAKPTSSG